MREKNIAALMVTSNEATLGIVTERDIVRAFARDGVAIGDDPVQDIMIAKLITGTPEDTVKHVIQVTTNHRIRRFPVYRDGKLRVWSASATWSGIACKTWSWRNSARDAYIATR